MEVDTQHCKLQGSDIEVARCHLVILPVDHSAILIIVVSVPRPQHGLRRDIAYQRIADSRSTVAALATVFTKSSSSEWPDR
eukprot:6175868-Pleurochrysis_carterae.AAC.5